LPPSRVLRRVRQRSRVLEHLAEVAHVDPADAHGTLYEMLRFVRGLFANPLPDDFAALNVHAADIGGGRVTRRPAIAASKTGTRNCGLARGLLSGLFRT
jgi:hypothetical protein